MSLTFRVGTFASEVSMLRCSEMRARSICDGVAWLDSTGVVTASSFIICASPRCCPAHYDCMLMLAGMQWYGDEDIENNALACYNKLKFSRIVIRASVG